MDQATAPVFVERSGDLIIATVDNPPINALSQPVRAGLLGAVDAFEAAAEVRALVIICAGRTFFAGADLKEFNQPPRKPRLGELIARLDACAKPIVAAIHGTALGGGFEISLACSYRVAAESARVGLPEVKLGLLPGSGGSLRLPRLVGVEKALQMIADGSQLGARHALEQGLIDEVVSGDLRAGAIAFAEKVLAAAARVRRVSDLPIPPFGPFLLAEKRAEFAEKYRGLRAPQIAVDLMEMIVKTPFKEAVDKEYQICKALIASPQSKALRHLFAAERAALKIDGLPAGAKAREVRKVAVVGPGAMGRGITLCFLNAGIPVTLLGLTAENLAAAREAIGKVLDGSVRRGSIGADEVTRRMSMLTTTLTYGDISDVDLAVEAVTEDLETKKSVFTQLDRVLGEAAIMVSNTSFLDVEALAASVSRPWNVAGMHFFNPANLMPLLENVRAERSTPDVLATLTELGKRLGKVPVMVGRSEGFVANRMLSKRSREAQFLLEEGTTPQQVDKVLVGFGFPMGPFALADLAGMDVMAAARAARFARMTLRERRCDIVAKLAAAERFGRKSGAGYYSYGEDGKPRPDPAVDEIIARHRAEHGIVARAIGDDEILERCLYAMINEGAKILEEGAAARPGDIDVIWASGFGWPRYLGGPMFYADQIGLPKVRDALRKYSALVGEEYFKPAALIDRMVREGRGFSS